jgi:ubiquinone/menaquinone biosynthesis C-methylase UbiE
MPVQKDPEGTEIALLNKFSDFRGRRVLEVGCGDGRLTFRYAEQAAFVAGVDLERDDLRIARIERGSTLEKSLALAEADSTRLPMAPTAFDFVLFSWSF